jgi:N-methylhydantoinase B
MDRCTMKVLSTTDGTINSAKGARGGSRGGRARALNRELDGSETVPTARYGITLSPGECVISYSPGGGSYGSPPDRHLGRVPHDLREGWISVERARDVCGVVTVGSATDDSLALDLAATQARRASVRSAG